MLKHVVIITISKYSPMKDVLVFFHIYIYIYIGHSALSFTLFEIAVPHYPLFSLLRQKIDVFLKKMVKIFWGATSRKVLFQMS